MSEAESINLRRTSSAASLALSFRSEVVADRSQSETELSDVSRHNSFSISAGQIVSNERRRLRYTADFAGSTDRLQSILDSVRLAADQSSSHELRWLEYFNLQDYRRYMKTVRAFDDERQPVEVIRSMIRVCGRDYWIPGSKVGGIATIPVDSWALQVEEYETLSYRRTMSDSLPYCWRAIQNGSVPNSALKCGSYVETDEDVYVAKAVIEAEKQCGMYVPSLSQAIIPSRGRSKRVSRDEVQILCTL